MADDVQSKHDKWDMNYVLILTNILWKLNYVFMVISVMEGFSQVSFEKFVKVSEMDIISFCMVYGKILKKKSSPVCIFKVTLVIHCLPIWKWKQISVSISLAFW